MRDDFLSRAEGIKNSGLLQDNKRKKKETKPATYYFTPELLKTLKMYAAMNEKSISEILEEAAWEYLNSRNFKKDL